MITKNAATKYREKRVVKIYYIYNDLVNSTLLNRSVALLTYLYLLTFVSFLWNKYINHLNLKVMALKFRKVQRRVLSGDDKDKVKTYAVAKSSSYCDMEKLCELISSRSAMQ